MMRMMIYGDNNDGNDKNNDNDDDDHDDDNDDDDGTDDDDDEMSTFQDLSHAPKMFYVRGSMAAKYN